MAEKTKAIIFDFDGVIADSFSYLTKFIAAEANKLPLAKQEIAELQGLSVRAVALELGHSWWRLPGLYYYGRYEFNHHIHELNAFDGMNGVIEELFKCGYKMLIVSSNSEISIKEFLVASGINSCFSKIYGNVGFGGKARILRRAVKKDRLSQANTYYVGDEIRDVLAARRAHIKSVAVGWGYNKSTDLSSHHPDVLIDRPEQLLEIFK